MELHYMQHNALVAQLVEPPALNRQDPGSSPGGCILNERTEEKVMNRVISLFREPDERFAPSLPPEDLPPLPADAEPQYFERLLAYLRQRRAEQKSDGSQEQN
jgi:hypothetical protein